MGSNPGDNKEEPSQTPNPDTRKNFVLRVSNRLYNQLEVWAADEFRSVNSQIEYLLSKAIEERNKTRKKGG